MSTALLARLKAVIVDGSTPVVSRQTQQPLSIPQYAAGYIWVEHVNSDGSAHSLTYDTVLFGVRLHPTDAVPAISLQGSNMDTDPDGEPADNWTRYELIPGHWTSVPPRIYGYNSVLLIGGDPDDRAVGVPHSSFKVTAENVHPGDDISVPDSQQPLAQGPAGADGVVPLPSPAPSYIARPAWNGAAWVWQQHQVKTVALLESSSAEVSFTWEEDFEDRDYTISVEVVASYPEAKGPWHTLIKSGTGATLQFPVAFEGDIIITGEEIIPHA